MSHSLVSRLAGSFVVVLLAAIVAVGCGGAGAGDGGIVPTRSAVVLTFSLDQTPKGEWAQARTVLRRIPSFGLVEGEIPGPQRVLDQLLLVPGGRVNLDYKVDVKPWLGTEGGAAGWLVDLDADQPIGYVMWVETDDEQAALKAVRKTLGAPRTRVYEGVDTFRGTDRTGDVHWAAFDGRLVLAPTQRSLEYAIDANHGSSLEDRDEWVQLTRPREGNDAVVTLVTTKQLWVQAREALHDSSGFSEKADGDDDVFPGYSGKQLEDAIDTYERRLSWMALQLGSSDRGLFLDVTTIGDTPVHEAAAGETRKLLDQLPATSVIALAATAGATFDDDEVDQMRQQVDQMRGQIEALVGIFQWPAIHDVAGGTPTDAKGTARLVDDIFDALDKVLADDYVGLLREGYSGESTLALLARDNELAVAGTAGVQDAELADKAQSTFLRIVADVLHAHSDMRLNRVTKGDTTTVTLSGIPAAKLRAKLKQTAGDKAKKALTNPLVRQFVRTQLAGAWQTTDELQLFGFPTWGLEQVQASTGGDGQLVDARHYARDLKRAKVPARAQTIIWFDVGELVTQVVEPIAADVSFLVDGQLDHVGGPVIWSTSSREHGDTVTHASFELLLYG